MPQRRAQGGLDRATLNSMSRRLRQPGRIDDKGLQYRHGDKAELLAAMDAGRPPLSVRGPVMRFFSLKGRGEMPELRLMAHGSGAQSIFAPEIFTSFSMMGLEASKSLRNWAAPPLTGSRPKTCRRAFICVEWMISTASFSSRSRMGLGVPAGASIVNQAMVLNSGSGKPASAMVGTPGRSARRLGPNTAIGRRRPALIWPCAAASVPRPQDTTPADRSWMWGASLL